MILFIASIQFDQPTLLLDGRDVYLEEGSAVIDAYVKYATDIAVALGATPEAASEQMKDMVDFEIQLAKVFNLLKYEFILPSGLIQ